MACRTGQQAHLPVYHRQHRGGPQSECGPCSQVSRETVLVCPLASRLLGPSMHSQLLHQRSSTTHSSSLSTYHSRP